MEHGYAGASLATIARRLSLTKGALTYHFRTKADFASYFVRVLRGATEQAGAHARAEYAGCGTRRLLLYFLLMRTWQVSEPRFAAGMSLFMDRASPVYEADQVIRDWLALSADALATIPGTERALPAQEAAEVFLVTNLGGAFFGRHVIGDAPSREPLRFVRHALKAAGVADVDAHAEAVLSRHRDALPALDFALIG